MLGDSYSLGVGLKDKTNAWVKYIEGRVQVFGFGGSGFVPSSSPCGPEVAFAARAAAAVASKPDVIIVEGGLYDFAQSANRVDAGFREVMQEIGTIPAIVVGPAPAPGRIVGATRVDATLKQLAAAYKIPYVSMIDQHFDYLPPRRLHITASSHEAYGIRVGEALASVKLSPPATPSTNPIQTAKPTGGPKQASGPLASPTASTTASTSGFNGFPWGILSVGIGGVLLGFAAGTRFSRARRRTARGQHS